MNAYDQTRVAVEEAKSVLRAADGAASSIAQLLEGRLRKIPSYILIRLKRELSHFNAKTGTWK